MTKLLCLVLVSLIAVGCAAEQLGDVDRTAEVYEQPPKLDLLAGELPEPLQSAYDLDTQGEELDLDLQRALHNFGVRHPTDARPWLLLAHDAVRSETYPFVVRYYQSAINAEPRAAEQAHVLGDVLQVVRHCVGATEQKEARQLITSSYVLVDAQAAVNDALVVAIAQQDASGTERLRALRDELAIDDGPKGPPHAARTCFAKPCSEVAADDADNQ